jgi:hypothetical protein
MHCADSTLQYLCWCWDQAVMPTPKSMAQVGRRDTPPSFPSRNSYEFKTPATARPAAEVLYSSLTQTVTYPGAVIRCAGMTQPHMQARMDAASPLPSPGGAAGMSVPRIRAATAHHLHLGPAESRSPSTQKVYSLIQLCSLHLWDDMLSAHGMKALPTLASRMRARSLLWMNPRTGTTTGQRMSCLPAQTEWIKFQGDGI